MNRIMRFPATDPSTESGIVVGLLIRRRCDSDRAGSAGGNTGLYHSWSKQGGCDAEKSRLLT